jgi:hypothetical protein
VDHALGDFVERSVAAGADDQIGAVLDVVAGDLAGRTRAEGGSEGEVVPVEPQDVRQMINQPVAAALKPARARIVDEDRLTVIYDFTFLRSGRWSSLRV